MPPARHNGIAASRRRRPDNPNVVEVIDLSTDSEDEIAQVNEISNAVPVRQQNEAEDPRLSYLKCVICLDSPTDLTATNCGHLFCHECITAALRVTSATSGTCPVCRRKLTVKSLIPLAVLKAPRLGAEVAVPEVELSKPSEPKPIESKVANGRANRSRAASKRSIAAVEP